jgi:hypothetical protein
VGTPASYDFQVRTFPAPPVRATGRRDTVHVFRRPSPAVGVLPKEREDYETWIKEQLGGEPWNGPRIPLTKPAYSQLLSDQDQRVWVRLSTTSALVPSVATPPWVRWAEGNVFDLIDRKGDYVCQISMPSGVEWLAAQGDFVWARAESPEGAPIVIVYRILWSE